MRMSAIPAEATLQEIVAMCLQHIHKSHMSRRKWAAAQTPGRPNEPVKVLLGSRMEVNPAHDEA